MHFVSALCVEKVKSHVPEHAISFPPVASIEYRCVIVVDFDSIVTVCFLRWTLAGSLEFQFELPK